MTTTYRSPQPTADAPVSSASVDRGPGHDHIRVFNRGILAGELTVREGDAREVVRRLVPGATVGPEEPAPPPAPASVQDLSGHKLGCDCEDCAALDGLWDKANAVQARAMRGVCRELKELRARVAARSERASAPAGDDPDEGRYDLGRARRDD